MATINLAPTNEYSVAIQKRQRLLLIITGVVIVLLLTFWAILFFLTWQVGQQNEKRQATLSSVETEIAKLRDTAERVVLFERRLQSMDTLLKQHVSWDPLLREIERLLPPSATLQQARMRLDDGTITVNGSTPNLDELAQTVASLTSSTEHPTIFKTVTLTHSERHEEVANNQVLSTVYNFGMEMSFDPQELRN